ncbi:MAG TPA: PRC and DUF2382 domain-containing protein [Longimicrobium sp.]|nr:PRC and DUF2382 domain-containing protein [Longimicrobium sp.]
MNDERLVPLHSLPDFDVADGYSDIRGFDAFLADGRRVGTVDELLVDPAARRVAAITLDGDGAMRAAGQVPIESVEIDTPSRRVLIRGDGAAGLMAAGTAGAAALRDDDATLLHPAARPEGGEERMTLAEEELALYKNRVSAGSVDVHKRVETRHVRESVPVMHEEVTVERRRVDNPDASTEVRYEGDTMIVPIVEEELVVQKRTVVREELVIRRKQVEREQVVEADLRRERVDVDGPGLDQGGMRADPAPDRAARAAGEERDLPSGDGPLSAGGAPDGVRVR